MSSCFCEFYISGNSFIVILHFNTIVESALHVYMIHQTHFCDNIVYWLDLCKENVPFQFYTSSTQKAKLHEHHISLSLLVQPHFALAQWTAMESSSMTLAATLTGNPHPYWRSSEQALLTSDKSVQYGTHWLVLAFHSQPQSPGFGICGILDRDCFQTNPAV